MFKLACSFLLICDECLAIFDTFREHVILATSVFDIELHVFQALRGLPHFMLIGNYYCWKSADFNTQVLANRTYACTVAFGKSEP